MTRAMIHAAMHHLKPLARMPTYSLSVDDETGSRASPAAVLLLHVFLPSEAHSEDYKRPRARHSYKVIVSHLKTASLLPIYGVNFCLPS